MMLTAWSAVNDQEFLEDVMDAKSEARAPPTPDAVSGLAKEENGPPCPGSVGVALARVFFAPQPARCNDSERRGWDRPPGDRPRSALLQPEDDQHDQHYEAPGHRHIENGHESPCCLSHATCTGHRAALHPGAQIMAAVFRHVLLIGPAAPRFRVSAAWRDRCMPRSILIRSATRTIHAASVFHTRRSR